MFQQQISSMQEQYTQQLESLEVTGSAGNGLVQITLNGNNEMKKIQIKPECVDPEDIDGLQLLIKAAYSDAQTQLKAQAESASPMAGGLPDLSMLGF